MSGPVWAEVVRQDGLDPPNVGGLWRWVRDLSVARPEYPDGLGCIPAKSSWRPLIVVRGIAGVGDFESRATIVSAAPAAVRGSARRAELQGETEAGFDAP